MHRKFHFLNMDWNWQFPLFLTGREGPKKIQMVEWAIKACSMFAEITELSRKVNTSPSLTNYETSRISTMKGRAMTAHHLVAIAVTAVMLFHASVARPLREARETAKNVTNVQMQLKLSINALSMITVPTSIVRFSIKDTECLTSYACLEQLHSQQKDACELWNKVVTGLHLSEGKSSEQSATAEDIRNSTCLKVVIVKTAQ